MNSTELAAVCGFSPRRAKAHGRCRVFLQATFSGGWGAKEGDAWFTVIGNVNTRGRPGRLCLRGTVPRRRVAAKSRGMALYTCRIEASYPCGGKIARRCRRHERGGATFTSTPAFSLRGRFPLPLSVAAGILNSRGGRDNVTVQFAHKPPRDTRAKFHTWY